MKKSRSFIKRFRVLKKLEIEKMGALIDESRKINEGEQFFSLGCLFDFEDAKKYSLYYITRKYGDLEGCQLELDPKLTWKSRYTLTCDFAFYLYQEFSVDTPWKIQNTLEACQKVVFNKLNLDLETNAVNEDFIHNPSRTALINNPAPYIYLMKNNLNGLYKIGYSKKPYKRESTLQSQEPDITMILLRKAPFEVENALHRKFKDKRVRGEWFELTNTEVREIEKFIINFTPDLAKSDRLSRRRR
jgi:hypothetical protein